MMKNGSSVKKRLRPLVSVIIPCYDQAKFLPESINSALAQTYGNLEIIVVNDGSPDDVKQIMDRYRANPRVRLLNQTNQGLAMARNNGVSISKGEYLQFLDADDLLLPPKIKLQMAEFAKRPLLGIVYCNYAEDFVEQGIVHEVSLRAEGLSERKHFRTLWGRTIFPPCVPLLRRDWFEQAGGFNPTYDSCEDLDFWLRLAGMGCKAAIVEKSLAHYRKHSASMTQTISHAGIWTRFTQLQRENMRRFPEKGEVALWEAINALNRRLQSRVWDFLMARKELAEAQRHLKTQTNNLLELQQSYRRQGRSHTRLNKAFTLHQEQSGKHIGNLERQFRKAAAHLLTVETNARKQAKHYAQLQEAYSRQEVETKRHIGKLEGAFQKAAAHAQTLEEELKDRSQDYSHLQDAYAKHDKEARRHVAELERAFKEAEKRANALEKELQNQSWHHAQAQEAFAKQEQGAKRYASELEAAFKEVERYAKSLEEELQKRTPPPKPLSREGHEQTARAV